MPQTKPAIANYDEHTADEIKQRLRTLSQDDLANLETYEKQGQARSTVLEAIAALRTDAPWPGYDDMEVEEVNGVLKERDGDTAGRVLDYERHHKGRTRIIDFAKRRQASSEGAESKSPSSPRSRGDEPWSGYDDMEVDKVSDALKRRDGETAGRVVEYERRHKGRKTIIEFAKRRQDAGEASARPKRPARSSSSVSSRRGSKSSSASRSTLGRSAKSVPAKTRTKSTSRPSATRSSGSQETKSSQSRGRPRSQSSGGSQSQADAREAALAKIRQRATQALRSGEGRTRSPAKDTQRAVRSKAKDTQRAVSSKAKETQRAVGSAAEGSRDAVGGAVKDTGQAVQAAASKAKTPALVGAATLAALGGGIALGRGSKVNLRKRKRVLGVPVPKRTAFGKATKQVSKAVDSAGSAGKQVGEWSDGLQELSQRIANGKSPMSKLSAGKSPVSKLT